MWDTVCGTGLGMQLVALNTSVISQSYSCVPGSTWVDTPGGMAYMFSDILKHRDNLTAMGSFQSSMPAFGEALWDYGYLSLMSEPRLHHS